MDNITIILLNSVDSIGEIHHVGNDANSGDTGFRLLGRDFSLKLLWDPYQSLTEVIGDPGSVG